MDLESDLFFPFRKLGFYAFVNFQYVESILPEGSLYSSAIGASRSVHGRNVAIPLANYND
jgi:hypothetical protein